MIVSCPEALRRPEIALGDNALCRKEKTVFSLIFVSGTAALVWDAANRGSV